MDDQQQEELKRQQQLEAERQKLTEEQRQKHDQFCALLKANEAYSTQAALEGARAIHALDGTQKLGQELRYIADRADQAALVDQRKAFAEADKQKGLEVQKAEPEKQPAIVDPQPQPTQEAVSAQQQEAERLRVQQLIATAKQLGQKDDVKAAAWVMQAETVDRQRRQGLMADFVTAETKTSVVLDRANQNTRDGSAGRDR